MDLSGRVLIEFHQRQAEFLKMELANCSRSANLASMMYQSGHQESAERTIFDAEQGYAMVLRFLSAPQYSRYLTIKATQEFRAKLGELRKTLDGLRRFQEVTEGANNIKTQR
jgi:hypothetical protein